MISVLEIALNNDTEKILVYLFSSSTALVIKMNVLSSHLESQLLKKLLLIKIDQLTWTLLPCGNTKYLASKALLGLGISPVPFVTFIEDTRPTTQSTLINRKKNKRHGIPLAVTESLWSAGLPFASTKTLSNSNWWMMGRQVTVVGPFRSV